MKYKGTKLDGPAIEVIVIPRGDIDVVFKAKCITSYDEFEALYPEPKAPMILRRGEEAMSPNTEDKTYKQAISDYNKAQTNWMILKSLEISEDLEWETVDMQKPETWPNYEKELEAAGFSTIHIGRIINAVAIVNGLDERKIQEAKKRFLATTSVQAQEPVAVE